MAGTVSQARTRNPGKVKTERIVTLTMVSDAAAGTIPDTTLSGLARFAMTEVITTPGGTPPTTAYRVYVTDSDGGSLFLGSSRSLSAKERQGGHETLGYYPMVDGSITVSIVATGSLSAADIGNSKEISVALRFVKRADEL